jgi:hypothetical protein
MDFTITGNAVTGTYTTAVSDPNNAPIRKPLVGTVASDLISFTVNWGSSITSWVGHGVEDSEKGPILLTLWHLVLTIPNETDPKNQWKSVLSGADEFFIV